MIEQILDDFHDAYGIEYVSLRYFNAAGADPDGEIGEDHRPESHLIPLVLKVALGQCDDIGIFGDDYQTDDGTCVRDYIHIEDLARAHLLSLKRLLTDKAGGVYNLGNGAGYSVMDIVEMARKVTGKPIPVKIRPRRPGDCAVLVGSSLKARSELGWHPQYPDLYTIMDTAWNWHRNNPCGYPPLK
jgi:UDP-glucose-4-epimerase GalE